MSYRLYHYNDFPVRILDTIDMKKKAGHARTGKTYSDCLIMCDTETSKTDTEDNIVVAWTASIWTKGKPLATIYGNKPSEFCDFLQLLREHLRGEEIYTWFHNLSYDYVFLRKFLFAKFGYPEKQLNTKPHYPISIKFENGIFIKDSLILSQRSLEKWANDLQVEHRKASGKWDYDKRRNQNEIFTQDELEYIEHDTLAGVECLAVTMKNLNKHPYTIPLTATGIPREQIRKRGKKKYAHNLFNKIALTLEQYYVAQMVYHGGFTHANRYTVGWTQHDVVCYDFASSYPFCMLAEKMPMQKFSRLKRSYSIQKILSQSDDYAFMFCLTMVKPRLKTYQNPMPALQKSKCIKTINPIEDNGRILCADLVSIYVTEMDAKVIFDQYEWDKHTCTDIYAAGKDYLPRWFTDYIYEAFTNKTKLKGGDPVAYALAKAIVNSLYGMCVQKPLRDDYTENYETGEFEISAREDEVQYNRYLENKNSILPYQWGCWVTSYAFYNVHQLGKCCEEWIYTDTDSVFGINWDLEKLKAYNDSCKAKLLANGYGAVEFNGKEYWLGVAEKDKECSEFRVMGAKRYCYRDKESGELKITVAGVPKKGAKCLQNDIENFKAGLIFDGATTGKLTHYHIYRDKIEINDGNEYGDSINLEPCDYLLDIIEVDENFLNRPIELEIQTYEE